MILFPPMAAGSHGLGLRAWVASGDEAAVATPRISHA